jgi:hypothetical protein
MLHRHTVEVAITTQNKEATSNNQHSSNVVLFETSDNYDDYDDNEDSSTTITKEEQE